MKHTHTHTVREREGEREIKRERERERVRERERDVDEKREKDEGRDSEMQESEHIKFSNPFHSLTCIGSGRYSHHGKILQHLASDTIIEKGQHRIGREI